jgi:outer membrane protein assembly factor BamB
MRTKALLASGLLVSCLTVVGRGGDWPQFRGPNGAAVTAESSLPATWAADRGVAWKVHLPGYGWSSPVVWGDKVFITTAVSEKQQKPSGGFGPGGGPGRFGGPPQPGQIVPPFLQEMLQLTAQQKKQLDELQKDVEGKLATILTDEQKKQLKEARENPGRGGPGGRGGRRFGGFPQPGQVLPASQVELIKPTAEQKKQLDELQKEVDNKLAGLLNDEQKKQLKDLQAGPGRGGFGRQRPPDAVYQWEVYCLDAADGKVLWKQTAAQGKPRTPKQASNTYATETPVTDGERVYAYFGMTGVFCYDFAGKLVWKADLGAYPMAMGNGTASSPVLDGGRLFIQCDNEEKSFLVALDARTGKELWRTPRTERTGWSTPLVWKNKKRTEIVCVGNPRVRSYDPQIGKQLWELAGMTGQIKASPAANEDLLFVGTGGGFGGFGMGGGRPGRGGEEGGGGGGKPLFAVKAGASGDISLKEGQESNAWVAWRQAQAGPATPSPLVYEDYLYVLEDRGGLLSCYEAKTGKRVYKERLPGARGFTSSPWACGGKLFFLDDSGTTHVVQAGPAFKVLGANRLGEMTWSSPAVAGGALFLRTVDYLYCIRGQGETK